MPMPAASTSMPMPSYAAALTAASNTAAGPALGLFLTTGAPLPLPAHAVIRSNVLQKWLTPSWQIDVALGNKKVLFNIFSL